MCIVFVTWSMMIDHQRTILTHWVWTFCTHCENLHSVQVQNSLSGQQASQFSTSLLWKGLYFSREQTRPEELVSFCCALNTWVLITHNAGNVLGQLILRNSTKTPKSKPPCWWMQFSNIFPKNIKCVADQSQPLVWLPLAIMVYIL